ncbi:Predicted unusual protein kinase regulating ubiquinone biosynthesis, AarF/ABC1/UbiB family [Roseivivax lentus]|uniref:Predicted unusual protein kinase regulating ubiquinone biosynthesis, AarF/ABC1/UbiB family n=1 Tax=Roseivivax lentus TaxID=633194 RepID=A0A1N7KYJ5_9RHOB|nr:AarF/ABC1/UbiB kinase family protein [Roseivivax lentus]SIS66631.1 Predicted unusual protein kinase regulating ubiquinone biosynthesis, AarF/ABC1/UbiB family [Roseivivax lentus]
MSETEDRAYPVPSSRLSRVGRMGRFATGVLGRAAHDGMRAYARGDRPGLGQLMMTPANAARLAEELSRMRGAAMKMGQLLSMEAGEVLPPELAQILARLRSEAHSMPPAQLKTVLSDNWGADFLKRFRKFDVRPIAAASIGQVHRAVTKDGRELAIKVQYPGIRASIDSDIRNLGGLLKWSGMLPKGLDLGPLLEEARLQLHEEADYTREAQSLAEFGAHLGDDPDFIVPGLAEALTTRDILAMDFIPSQPIESLTEADAGTRNRVAEKLIALTLRELFALGAMQTDPNFANFRYQAETGRIVLLDFGAVRRFEPARVAIFRDLMRATLSADRAATHEAAIAVGYLRGDTAAHHREQILDMMEIAAAPLQDDAPFDFARAGLATRFAEAGQHFAEDRDFAVIPPVDALFLQRKVGGLYLLCARLGAKVPVRPLLAAHA